MDTADCQYNDWLASEHDYQVDIKQHGPSYLHHAGRRERANTETRCRRGRN